MGDSTSCPDGVVDLEINPHAFAARFDAAAGLARLLLLLSPV